MDAASKLNNGYLSLKRRYEQQHRAGIVERFGDHNLEKKLSTSVSQATSEMPPIVLGSTILRKMRESRRLTDAWFLAILIFLPMISGFVEPSQVRYARNPKYIHRTTHFNLPETPTLADITWSPQDLTRDNAGFQNIPDDDYIKLYQKNPELWPVEFFLIAHRQSKSTKTGRSETQVLVRKSANRTSKYGVGTGVPATRWLLSSSEPPRGYEWSNPTICFDANKFPEYDTNQKDMEPWTYQKIDICENAFHDPHEGFEDPSLEEYARTIRDHLQTEFSTRLQKNESENYMSSWETERIAVVQKILDQPNSVAAIQGTLRMSGLFEKQRERTEGENGDSPHSDRYIALEGATAPDPLSLAKSVQIHTMFPQMPDPMPLPSTTPEELKKEITSRYSRMIDDGKDLHKDKYGRTYTHISTSNVSNTIHGVYLSLDLTGHLEGDESVPPALDLFGTKTITREWKCLKDLKVLGDGGKICTEDPKPTFISGFIVRQLVMDGIIGI